MAAWAEPTSAEQNWVSYPPSHVIEFTIFSFVIRNAFVFSAVFDLHLKYFCPLNCNIGIKGEVASGRQGGRIECNTGYTDYV
jgi:hypothetical protein